MELLTRITRLSREFGTPAYVKGGGGNTSAKDTESLWVKPSGTNLSQLNEDSFLEIDRTAVKRLYSVSPPDDDQKREDTVRELLKEARRNPEDPRRPSVETPLHDSLSYTFVVHTHPPEVNGLLCGKNSKQISAELFPDYLYMEFVNPGYCLCMEVRRELERFKKERGFEPKAILLENHGVVAGGNTPEEIRKVYSHIFSSTARRYEEAGLEPELETGAAPDGQYIKALQKTVASVCGEKHASCVESCGLFKVPEGPLTPDHIVYMGSYPFYGEPEARTLSSFLENRGYPPRVFVTDKGVVCFGAAKNDARLAMELAKDGALVAKLAGAFGGVRYMSDQARHFIENWESEAYRKQLGSQTGPA